MNNSTSLARGYELNPETWADFVERLHEGVRGSRVDDHCTADAIFEVQELHTVYGIDTAYTDNKAVYCNEDCELCFKNPDDWLACIQEFESGDIEGWESLSEIEKWSCIEDYSGWTVTGYSEEWRHVNSHLTHEAAEAFIARKKHDFGKLQIFVESRYWCWEFNAIINGILDGKIVLASADDKSGEVAA